MVSICPFGIQKVCQQSLEEHLLVYSRDLKIGYLQGDKGRCVEALSSLSDEKSGCLPVFNAIHGGVTKFRLNSSSHIGIVHMAVAK